MPKGKQDPYRSYDIDDWKWEFLRRNPRYRRVGRAVEWLLRNTSGRTRFHGTRAVGSMKLRYEMESRYGDSLNISSLGLPPSHDIPAHQHEEKPLRKSTRAVSEIEQWSNPKSTPHRPPTLFSPQEHELAVVIDTRHGAKLILSELKKKLQRYKSKERHQISNYKDYLSVWDLRQKGWTDSQIARKLWPKDWKRIGGRDPSIGVKGPLIQRVHDYEKAARKLIKDSFPPHKKRPPKIKK